MKHVLLGVGAGLGVFALVGGGYLLLRGSKKSQGASQGGGAGASQGGAGAGASKGGGGVAPTVSLKPARPSPPTGRTTTTPALPTPSVALGQVVQQQKAAAQGLPSTIAQVASAATQTATNISSLFNQAPAPVTSAQQLPNYGQPWQTVPIPGTANALPNYGQSWQTSTPPASSPLTAYANMPDAGISSDEAGADLFSTPS